MSEQLTVLVTGATGNQGGAVANALLERGHKVRALTRNPGSTLSGRLAERGAKPIQGDLDNIESVSRALQGVDSFYLTLLQH